MALYALGFNPLYVMCRWWYFNDCYTGMLGPFDTPFAYAACQDLEVDYLFYIAKVPHALTQTHTHQSLFLMPVFV